MCAHRYRFEVIQNTQKVYYLSTFGQIWPKFSVKSPQLVVIAQNLTNKVKTNLR